MKKTFLCIFLMSLSIGMRAERRHVVQCKTPELAPSCIQIHGRLGVYQGSQNWRLWQIGTNHLWAIYSDAYWFKHNYDPDADHIDSEAPILPNNLKKAFRNFLQEPWVYADYEICPLDRHKVGHMQAACIASAKHLFIQN